MSFGCVGRYFFGMNDAEPNARNRQRAFSWPLALVVIFLIAAVVGTVIFLRLESWPARTAKQGTAELERLGRDVRDAFVDVAQLQPRIRINNRVYLEKTTAVAEMAVVSRQIEVEHELMHTWAGSTKRVKLHGTFAVKAGFDLREDITVDVLPDAITVRMPVAKILGVEQQLVDVLAFENGFWNRISAADLESELAVLPDLARQKAGESDVIGEAQREMQRQLTERLHAERPLHLTFAGAAPKS